MTELPTGWEHATLHELGVQAQPGFASGKHNRDGDGVVHLRPMNITREGRIDLSNALYVADSSGRRVRTGDVLFNNTNSPALVGKTALVTTDGPLAYSNHMTRLRAPKGLRSDFLAAQLHWLWMSGYFKTVLNNHVNQASVAAARLLETPIVVAPEGEQRRVVAFLEDHLSLLKSGLTGLDRTTKRLEAWRGSMLAQAMRGTLVTDDLSEGTAFDIETRNTNGPISGPWCLPETWAWRRIGDLFKVFVGTTPSRSNPQFWSGPIPWVSSGEVAFGHICDTREKISEIALGNPATRLHQPGTVLIAMIGEGRTRGQTAILDIAAAHNQNCASIRVSDTPIIPEYVYWLLYARYDENRRVAAGGNQPALNKAKIEDIEIPLAPLGTQRKIVTVLNEADRQISRMGDGLDTIRKQAAFLKEKIFMQAFSGHLTPRDPTDEPASVLLERLRAMQSAGSIRKKASAQERQAL